MAKSVKVLDTYLRGLKRLTNLRSELELLEEDVAERETEALARILALLDPLLPDLGRPLSIREPWLDGAEERHHELEGLPVLRSFEGTQGEDGHNTHQGKLLAVVAGGRLIEVSMQGTWNEGPPVSDTSWHVETRELTLSPALARTHLKPVLTGILDQLREALDRGRSERKRLQQRLNLLAEVDELLSIDDDGR